MVQDLSWNIDNFYAGQDLNIFSRCVLPLGRQAC
jgi:hypothetical protein